MSKWFRTHPVFVLLIPLIAVVVCCYYTGFPTDIRHLCGIPEADYLDSLHTYEVVIRDYPSPRKKTIRYTADLWAVIDSIPNPIEGKIYLYLMSDSSCEMPTYGDTLYIRARVHSGAMLNNFDYGRYLNMRGFVGQAVVWRDKWQLKSHDTKKSWFAPVRWQHGLHERYKELGITADELGTLSALTLGYKEELDPEIKQSFQRSGAAHVLAVSGLHTGIIYMVLVFIITLGGLWKPMYEQRWLRWIQSIIIIVLMWGYALLTGLTPSVVRSVLMLTLYEFGIMAYRRTVSLNIVCIAAFLILVFRPTDLFSVSFQLSFAAVISILMLYGPLSEWLPIRSIKNNWIQKLVKYIWDLLVVSIAAQIGTIPFTLYYFGQCSNYFLLTNLIVLPLAWLIVVGALLLLTIGWIPYIGIGLAWPVRGLVWIMNTSVGWIESLPGSFSCFRIDMSMVLLLYMAIGTGYIAIKRSLWWLILTAGCLIAFCYLYTII